MKKRAFKEKLKVTLNSPLCADILKSAFWWFYLDQFKPNKYKEQKDKLYHLASSKFVMLVMRQLDESDSFMSRFPFVLGNFVIFGHSRKTSKELLIEGTFVAFVFSRII